MSNVIYVLNGPNLNLLGKRQPEIYGSETLDDVQAKMITKASALNLEIEFFQSNYEGALVEKIHEARESCKSPGGYPAGT